MEPARAASPDDQTALAIAVLEGVADCADARIVAAAARVNFAHAGTVHDLDDVLRAHSATWNVVAYGGVPSWKSTGNPAFPANFSSSTIVGFTIDGANACNHG